MKHRVKRLVLLVSSYSLSTRGKSSAASSLVPISSNVLHRIESAFIGGLCGDALALGGHYEYDAAKIKAHVGKYTDFLAPGAKMGGQTHGVGWGAANYHPGKTGGDLTDAGEVAIFLLDYLATTQGQYDFDGYAKHWLDEIRNGYGSCNFQSVLADGSCPAGSKPGYLNGGTRRTLQALQQRPGATGDLRKALAADVNCLVAATHFLPLFLVATDVHQLVADAKSTVYLSHKNRDPVAAAEFLTRAFHAIFHGDMALDEALTKAAHDTGDPFITKCLADAQRKVAEASDPQSDLSTHPFVDDVALTSMARLWDVGKSEPIKVGKASPAEGALPGSLYFALRYAHSLEEALVANAGVGGDSAVRGMVIGMLLGAVHGREGIPARWLGTLKALPHVEAQFGVLRQGQARGVGKGGQEL